MSDCCTPGSSCCAPTRRDLLKFAGVGAAAFFAQRVFAGPFEAEPNAGLGLDANHPVPLDKKLSPEWAASLTARGEPSAWSDWAALQHIGMPVAGIGSGTVYLGGDGRLWGWDLFNVPHEGCVPNKTAGIAERNGANYLQPPKMESPWNLQQGLVLHVEGQAKALDHTGFPQVTFTGQYPIGKVDLRDPTSPVSAQIETFSPFIPLAYDDSSLPLAVMEVTLKNAGDQALEVELEAFLENGALRTHKAGALPGVQRVAKTAPLAGGALVQGTAVFPEGLKRKPAADEGSLALAMLGEGAVAQARRGEADSAESSLPLDQPQVFAVRKKLTLPARGEAKAVVLLAWHFPHVHPGMEKLPDPRRRYAATFADAAAVAAHGAREHARLSAQTKLFRDTWYGAESGEHRGTLPHWLLERALWTVSTLTTNGTYRLTDGRVWGWEGTGCCAGTCTHVWHYGQSAGRLFPQFEIDLRERTDFTPSAMSADGCIGFRGSYDRGPCIDGQTGLLLRCYREHLSDPSGQFLRRNWESVKKATEFLVRAEAEGKRQGNDGVFTRRFENTLDAKWGGEIPWLVGMYLAGLSASAAMAEAVGDQETAKRWRAIVAKGSAAYAGYFDKKAGYYKAKYAPKDLLPVHIGPGSHIDMCLGDFWLAQVGLPPLGGKAQLRQAMDSLFKYNFVPDMGVFRKKTQEHGIKPGRHYALAGEAGLVMATWPHGGLPDACKHAWQFGYFQECMSGFEHSAAALMVSLAEDEKDPLLTQGLAVCRAVHDRYDAVKRNPYNEVECSDHYARAMSSYGVFIAAGGFHCDASKGLLRFDPKIRPDDCAMPFVGAGAWGRFAQTRTAAGLSAKVDVRFGAMRLARLELAAPAGLPTTAKARTGGQEVPCRTEIRDGRLAVILAQTVTLTAGQALELAVG